MHKPTYQVILAGLLLLLSFTLGGCRDKAPATVTPVVGKQPSPGLLVTAPPVTPKPGVMPSDDKHAAHGVSCEQCHGIATPTSAPTSNKACLTCHEHDALVKATAKYDDVKHKSQNPHDSHLHGVSCFVCHKNHSASVLYCDECHKPKFGWKVP